MRLGKPFDDLIEAVGAAVHRDLPDITYEDRDWDAWRKLSKEEQVSAMKTDTVPRVSRTRRLTSDEIEVVMFPQTWGSTALGYGGMGGAAVTPAYTVIVSAMHGLYHCVYFGYGRLAYRLKYDEMSSEGRERFQKDIASQNMAPVNESVRYK